MNENPLDENPYESPPASGNSASEWLPWTVARIVFTLFVLVFLTLLIGRALLILLTDFAIAIYKALRL